MENKRVFLHRKLSDLLKKEIKEGKYKPGEYIPSERELSESYSLSRPTVRRAISQLVREGWLYSVAGTGTLVSENIALKEKQTVELDLVPTASGKYPLECTEFLHSMFGMTGSIEVAGQSN